jgi:AraC family transcriptional regulator
MLTRRSISNKNGAMPERKVGMGSTTRPPAAAGESRREEYLARINRVVDHIEKHIGEDLSLEGLSSIACFSKYHFHRIFAAMVGETLCDYILRLRLEKAAARLLANPKATVTDIALDCGFANPSTFARAFRDYFGMSATAWRAGLDLDDRKNRQAIRKIRQLVRKARQDKMGPSLYRVSDLTFVERRLLMKQNLPVKQPDRVGVQDLPEVQVAYVRHTGPYAGDAKLFERLFGRLYKWAGPRGLLRPDSLTLTLYHDSPELTDPGKQRISVCLSVPKDTPVEGEIGTMAVHGGRYAVGRFELKDDEYGGAWNYMAAVWMPESGYQFDDFPCMEIYRNNPAEHPEHKCVVDICIPVKPL